MRHQPLFRISSAAPFRPSLVLALVLALAASSFAQNLPAPDNSSKPATTQPVTNTDTKEQSAAPSSQEVVTRDSSTTFKVRVNLVLVRVVVRDEHGKIVENLRKEDFQLSCC